MVPAEYTALPEICDVAWQLLQPGHADCVAGQLRQSLLIGFIIALALKGLVDQIVWYSPPHWHWDLQSDFTLLPTPPATVRAWTRWSQLALIQASAASFKVNSEARLTTL